MQRHHSNGIAISYILASIGKAGWPTDGDLRSASRKGRDQRVIRVHTPYSQVQWANKEKYNGEVIIVNLKSTKMAGASVSPAGRVGPPLGSSYQRNCTCPAARDSSVARVQSPHQNLRITLSSFELPLHPIPSLL